MSSGLYKNHRLADMGSAANAGWPSWPAEPVVTPTGPGGCPVGSAIGFAQMTHGPACVGVGHGPQLRFPEANAQLWEGPTRWGPRLGWDAGSPRRRPMVSPLWALAQHEKPRQANPSAAVIGGAVAGVAALGGLAWYCWPKTLVDHSLTIPGLGTVDRRVHFNGCLARIPYTVTVFGSGIDVARHFKTIDEAMGWHGVEVVDEEDRAANPKRTQNPAVRASVVPAGPVTPESRRTATVAAGPVKCAPGEKKVRSPEPPFNWVCRPIEGAGSCPPRQVDPRELQNRVPAAYDAGCRVFDAACRKPPGWIPIRGVIFPPAPMPGEQPKPPTKFVACPPSCFVYEDAVPTATDPIPYCSPIHPDRPGDHGCGDRPCPPGSRRTDLHPAGWNHPDYGWYDSYQVCCPTR